MDSIVKYYEIIAALIGGAMCWLLGGFDSLIYALIAFVSVDYLTGLLVAIRKRRISSSIGSKGISQKIMIFTLIAIANIIDQYIVNAGSTLRTMVIIFYLSNEGISIVENAGNSGLPLPQKLKEVLQTLNQEKRD